MTEPNGSYLLDKIKIINEFSGFKKITSRNYFYVVLLTILYNLSPFLFTL